MIPVLTAGADPGPVVAQLIDQMRAARRYDIGFPGATDLTFPGLADLFTGQLLNNVGDPWDDGHGRNHTKAIERWVVGEVADLLRAPRTHWGYVTTGSSEGTLHALHEAGRCYPDVIVYTSTAAHYSVAKSAQLLKLPLVTVTADRHGCMDVAALRDALTIHRDRPAVIVATAGTTMTEAVDDVAAITAVCEDLHVVRRRIHVDAALAGLPLALLPPAQRPGFDFAAGATSMVVSGHKFLSTLTPCGVLIHARAPGLGDRIAYTGSADTTITGSRSGHTPLLLWWALTTLGREGLRDRAEQSRRLAEHTHQQLRDLGWPSDRRPHAFTVTLRTPPAAVLRKWVLATADDGTAHIVCMPGIHRDQIEEFVDDLRTSTRRRAGRHQIAPVSLQDLLDPDLLDPASPRGSHPGSGPAPVGVP